MLFQGTKKESLSRLFEESLRLSRLSSFDSDELVLEILLPENTVLVEFDILAKD